MKKKITFLITFGLLGISSFLFGQGIDFTIRYNSTDNLYEVYGKADFTQTNYFVGGGSQISIVFPESIPDESLSINTIAGGFWSDNSQVFAPTISPNVDYHGIASNGSLMNWTADVEQLLFTFSIPNEECLDGIRIFENSTDPSSKEPSMFGADFQNFFANALTFENRYRSNYDNAGTACDKPVISINPITTLINTLGQGCANIINSNDAAIHAATVCEQGIHGAATVEVDNVEDEFCLNFQPDAGYVGPDSICVEVCDDNGACFQTMVDIYVFENNNCSNQLPVNTSGTDAVCEGEMITLYTNYIGSEFIYQWTNARGNLIGQGDTLNIASNNLQAIPPFQVRRSRQNCADAISAPFDVEIIDFDNLQIDNQTGTVCQGGDITLSITGLSGGAYSWYNANTNQLVAVGANPIIENIQEDITLRLTVNYNGCTNSQVIETTIQVETKPTIENILRSITVCRGEDVLLAPTTSSSFGGEIRYFWNGPNEFNFKNTTNTDSFPLLLEAISPDQAGAYSIDIISENGCEVDSRSIVINVSDDLVAPTLITNQNTVCNGGTVVLTASLQNDEEVIFEWYRQNTNDELELLTETNIPSYIIENAGTTHSGKYLVRVKDNGCISGFSNISLIEVLDSNEDILTTNSTSINEQACDGSIVQLNAPFFEDATYEWFGPAGFTADIYNPFINQVSITHAGAYFAVISTNDCPGIVTQPTTVYVQTALNAPVISGNSEICEGASLRINIQNPSNLKTVWYHATTGRVVGTTFSNELVIDQIQPDETGEYYAIFENDACVSPSSNRISVDVIDSQNLSVNAGNDLQICSANFVSLRATSSNTTFGQWSSSTGAIIDMPNADETTASNLIAGANIFVYTVQNSCGQQALDTVIINLLQGANNVANAGSNIETCDQSTVTLNALSHPNAVGVWTQSESQANQGVQIQNPDSINTHINGLQGGNAYRFNWTLSTANCPSFSTDEVLISVDEQPEEIAFITSVNEEVAACEGTATTITARSSLFNTGMWTSLGGGQIANPLESTATITDLPVGTTQFVWSLSNGACRDFSADTLTIYRPESIAANADQYEINLNDSLTFNVFENDQAKNLEDLRFVITKYPDKGTLREEEDGSITYIPQRNFFGADNFRYKLCDLICESTCDTAMVNLLVNGGDGASGTCFIPNVMTPNSDGVNDQFLIGCLDDFPEASVKIFNRWGDVVHEAAPYTNNWAGEFQGKPVPAGTYYYYLKLTPESEPIQSFFSIFR